MSTLDERYAAYAAQWDEIAPEGVKYLVQDLYAEVKKLRNDSTTESRNGFKVGDRVRILNSEHTVGVKLAGLEGTVRKTEQGTLEPEYVWVDVENDPEPMAGAAALLLSEVELCF